MWEEDKAEVRERYRSRWQAYGYDPRTLGWMKDCQWVRFKAAFEGLAEEDFGSVLDVGCGFGDLLYYLRYHGWKGRYVGIDLVPELVHEAGVRHGDDSAAEFICGDVGTLTYAPPCDLAVAIGVFNHVVKQGNRDFIQATLDRMWALSARSIVCDFLSTSSDPDRRKSNLYYGDPADMYQVATRYSRRIMIHHAYMPFEFQLKIWHDDSFSLSEPVFSRYSDLARRQLMLAGRKESRLEE
jgi:SAM-dependent methyltransferase